MSGYQRGGVQMAGYRAAPAVHATAALNASGIAAASATASSSYVSHYPTQQAYAQQYYQHQSQQHQQQQSQHQYVAQRRPPTVMDDYERWYTEGTPTNRMLLALRSGLDDEVAWALDRLCRLCNNEQFHLSAIPGLLDALFEWPEWYVREYGRSKLENPSKALDSIFEQASLTDNKGDLDEVSMFSPSPLSARRRRHAMESLFILRNAALNDPNAAELSAHARTRSLILGALYDLQVDETTDERNGFVLHCIELLQAIASTWTLPSAAVVKGNPISALDRLVYHSQDRSIIISSLSALTLLLSNPANSPHASTASPSLSASIRYLPLFADTPLVDTCLNFLYTHLSYPAMTKAFLLHPDMPSALKLLVSYIIHEQVEELRVVDISAPRRKVPNTKVKSVNYELIGPELERIGSLPEPERCSAWMKAMFVANPEDEITQVEFWTGYKDSFSRFQDRYQLLVASDVIKNVSSVFAQAQAMVLPGPPQKFVIRGISRRKVEVPDNSFTCQWDRASCASNPFYSPEDLHKHVKTHLDQISISGTQEYSCLWASCQHSALSPEDLVPHVWTHLALRQAETLVGHVTLATDTEPYPNPKPTERPAPPPQEVLVRVPSPVCDPPSGALTALLILRTLFRASFASCEDAPRADADHFGFPGMVEENDDQERNTDLAMSDTDKEGEKRGRLAFMCVRHLMERVHIRDPVLMSWITEMVDAGFSGSV